MRFPAPLERLIALLSRLPSVGPKTAERYAFHLLTENQGYLRELSASIAELPQKVGRCSVCYTVSEHNPCSICADQNRDPSALCIVADTRDLYMIEDTNQYKGYYFVLGGTINTIEGVTPEDIRIKELVERIRNLKPREIILALDPTLEGETTVLYLNKLIKPSNIKITRLAKGLPSGANIEYADELTLGNALKFRNEI